MKYAHQPRYFLRSITANRRRLTVLSHAESSKGATGCSPAGAASLRGAGLSAILAGFPACPPSACLPASGGACRFTGSGCHGQPSWVGRVSSTSKLCLNVPPHYSAPFGAAISLVNLTHGVPSVGGQGRGLFYPAPDGAETQCRYSKHAKHIQTADRGTGLRSARTAGTACDTRSARSGRSFPRYSRIRPVRGRLRRPTAGIHTTVRSDSSCIRGRGP